MKNTKEIRLVLSTISLEGLDNALKRKNLCGIFRKELKKKLKRIRLTISFDSKLQSLKANLSVSKKNSRMSLQNSWHGALANLPPTATPALAFRNLVHVASFPNVPTAKADSTECEK